MSNFETLTNATGGVPGTAPNLFTATTPDDLATVTTVGYLNDLNNPDSAGVARNLVVKNGDYVFLNYLSDTTPTQGIFLVVQAVNDFSLVLVI